MTARRDRTAVVPQSLRGLRLRLTAWYVGTLLAILALVGVGLFATVTARIDSDLDTSLEGAARAMAAAVQERGAEASAGYLSTPDRRLILFDSAGVAIGQRDVPSWLGRFATHAVAGGRSTSHHDVGDQILRAYGEPVRARDGHAYVAVAVADEIEVEDKYTALLVASVIASLVALIIVGIGGWFIAGKSTEPVDRAFAQMRRFMADAAHELRTPLTVVRSRAEVTLQRPRERKEYEEALRGIERESTRVGGIVEDLLTLARADAGERPIDLQRVFLDDIVLDTAEAAKVLAAKRNVRLSVAEFHEAPIIADPALIRQLVMILLDNAIKFSESGAVVSVGASRLGDGAVLTVVDGGIGISPDQLPHVFERFYRGDTARSRSGTSASEGAGLGLSIAHWIAEEHGATIRIESDAGKGTRVVVQFPPPNTDLVSAS